MNAHSTINRAAAIAVTVALTSVGVTAQELPVVKGKKVVASVQGEPITLAEFDQQMTALKREQTPGTTVDKRQELALLNRMIDMVLIAQEARRMGLDKLPEIQQVIDTNAKVALREELVERVVKDVKADPQAVEKIYRPSVQQWKVSAVLFAQEEPARAMATDLNAGKSFGEVAKTYLDQGKAIKVEEGTVLTRQAMDPDLGRVVPGMTVGAVSPVFRTQAGFVIVRLDEILYPDDPAAKAQAEQIVVTAKRKEAVTVYDEALRKKWVKVNRALLDSLDFEKETPGVEALLKDKRVVAEVKGETPVTVADMAEALKFQFFHGTTMAAERKKVNVKKEQILDGLLHRKVFRMEALRLGLDKTDSYRSALKEFETATLFGVFLRKVVGPGIQLTEQDVKTYYDEHRREYSSPEMIRIKSLAFAERKDAEAAAESLRKGADFQWVASQAGGQVDPNAEGVMSFDGRPIMTSELPEGVRKAVAGAAAGDARLHAGPDQRVYVLVIQGVVAAQPQPYEQVRREMAEKVFDLKLQRAVEEYATKLRGLSVVEVYLKAS
jgi:parvulin-like peptidyl-prolyl isomerase